MQSFKLKLEMYPLNGTLNYTEYILQNQCVFADLFLKKSGCLVVCSKTQSQKVDRTSDLYAHSLQNIEAISSLEKNSKFCNHMGNRQAPPQYIEKSGAGLSTRNGLVIFKLGCFT